MSEIALYLLFVIFILAIYLFLNHTQLYFELEGETGVAEVGGFLAILFSGILLILSARHLSPELKGYNYRKWMLIGAGIVFLITAGEEISWGQHWLGFGTPDWLMGVNTQNEMNFHNMNKKFFDRTQERLVVLLTLITAYLHLRGQEKFLGFRMPQFPLNLGFILLPVYRRFDNFALDVWQVGILPFFAYVLVAIRNKDWKALMMCGLSVVVGFAVFYPHRYYTGLLGGNHNVYHEIREFGFSVLCLFFAFQIFLDAKSESA